MRQPTSAPSCRHVRAALIPILCWLASAALLFAAALFAASPTPALAAGEGPAAPAAALSTPQLIEQAFVRGEISAEQRLLYLAYAVFEHESLPPQFHSSTPWYGTAVVLELQQAAASPSAAASSYVYSELERLLAPAAATVCGEQDGPNASQSANFRVNYGTIGGGLTIDDYLASLQTAYGALVTDYGWAPVPFCQAGLGGCSAANPWSRYPVQLANLGPSLYGYATTGGGDYTGWVGDNPLTPATETEAYASCLVLNNDYTGFPGSPRMSLDVTTAHEFFHALQFSLGDPAPIEDDLWYEATASYIEDEVQDAVNDNYNYLWPEINVCLGQYTQSPYAYWLFPRYAAEHNGGVNVPGGGEEIMQSFWTNVAAGQGALAAYDAALGVAGANLADTFHNYAIASRFLLSCPAASPFCFEEAAGYLAKAGPVANHGQIAAIGGSYLGSLQNNFAANWIGLPSAGVYSISLTNLSGGGVFHASIVAQVGNDLVVTPFGQLVAGNAEAAVLNYRPPLGAARVVAVITNQQVTAENPAACTSNSYRLTTSEGGVDLVLVGRADPEPVMTGSPLTYTFTLSNRSDITGTAVVLTDTLPGGLAFAAADATQGACSRSGQEVICNLGSLAGSAVATVTLAMTPTTTGVLTNVATVTAAEMDPDASSNTAAVVTAVLPVADLALSMEDAAGPVYTGAPITYTLVLSNAGPDTAPLVVLTDTLPAGMNFVAASASQGDCTSGAGSVVCRLGTLAPGSSASVTLVVTAAQSGVLTNSATVTAAVIDPNAGNNTAAQETTAMLHQLYLPAIARPLP